MRKVLMAAFTVAFIAMPVLAERNQVTPTPAAKEQRNTKDGKGKMPPYDRAAGPVTPTEPDGAKAVKFGRDHLASGSKSVPAATPAPGSQGATINSAEASDPPESGGPGGKPADQLRMITGKVISQSGNSFKVISSGKGKMPAYGREGGTQEFTFSAAKLKVLPKIGEVIDITYTQTPGGPLEATTVNTSKSNTF